MSPMMRRLVVMCVMIAVAPTASAGAREDGQGQDIDFDKPWWMQKK
jgi:hypothetical protein